MLQKTLMLSSGGRYVHLYLTLKYFFVTDLINRIMLSYIQPLLVLPSMSYHARHHLFPASAFFRQLNKLLMIDDRVWDQRGLRSYS